MSKTIKGNDYGQVILFAGRLSNVFEKNKKLRKKDLATKCNVMPCVVTNWIKIKSQPTLTNLYSIFQFLIEQGIKPLQTIFPEILAKEFEELNLLHEEEFDNLEYSYSSKLDRANLEKYEELESDMADLQQQYDDLKKRYRELENDFFSYKKLYD